MIFVTVGTTPFEGLIEAIDGSEIKDEVIIQRASGKYAPKNYESFEYSDDFDDYLKKADIVVTHGGAGTIYQLLAMGKRVVGVANDERTDLHQSDLLKKLSDDGCIVWCKDLEDLKQAITDNRGYCPKQYVAPGSNIGKEIVSFLS